jgi:cell division protein FtsW
MALRRSTRPSRPEPPVEHRILLTATLCLLAVGAVMVYSASSARDLLKGGGDGTSFLAQYLVAAGLGLVALRVLSRLDLRRVLGLTPLLLAGAFALLLAVLVIGTPINGARRWIGTGFAQVQPSELLKFALLLYAVRLLATLPGPPRTLRDVRPLLLVAGAACALVAIQPDLGTALVVSATLAAILVAAGLPLRQLGLLVGVGAVLVALFALVEPYRMARLTAFLHPEADPSGAAYQSVQGQIALGSGGLFGVGLGQSVQKVFYLPEAHTDFILAVVGEELGVAGVLGLLTLYGMIAVAGLRVARRAVGVPAQLLAAGVTSLIVCQALLNVFTVLGLAPVTGVPLPFISYGSNNLVVLMAGMGLLLNVAAGGSVAARGRQRARARPPARRDGRRARPAARSAA